MRALSNWPQRRAGPKNLEAKPSLARFISWWLSGSLRRGVSGRRSIRPLPGKIANCRHADGILDLVDRPVPPDMELELRALHERVQYLEAHISRLEGRVASANHAAAPEAKLPGLGNAIVEREALLAEAESIAHLGSWFWDTQTNEVCWSDQLYRVLGYEPGSVQPSVEAFLRRIHRADRALFITTNRSFIEGTASLPNGMLPRIRVRLFREGEKKQQLVELSGRVVLAEDGRPRRVVGIVHDLTRTQAAVSALEEASEILRMANQIQGLATWRWNLSSGEVSWSKEMRTLLGLDPSVEPSVLALLDALHPDDRELARFSQEEEKLPNSGEPLELRFVRPDGKIRHVVSSFGTFQDSGAGAERLIVGILVDVSERHALQDELRQAKKMEALGRMAGGVAHDFNNYLTVMMGNADLLGLALQDQPSGEGLQPMVEEIMTASERCQSMTQRLLAFCRRRKTSSRVLDIAQLASERESMLRCLAGAVVELKLECDAGPCQVRVDETHFEQLLMNLVTNARDAMPEGGNLLIRIYSRSDEGEQSVCVEVQDSGVGMDKETQERVFEPFFTTKEEGQGSGLGLSMVYGIVQQHNGRIEVNSEVGQGTCVSVIFPACATQLSA